MQSCAGEQNSGSLLIPILKRINVDISDRSKFQWTDGSALQYEGWAPNEPNNKDDENDDCVEMFNEHWPGLWNDHICNVRRGYVCKAPKSRWLQSLLTSI